MHYVCSPHVGTALNACTVLQHMQGEMSQMKAPDDARIAQPTDMIVAVRPRFPADAMLCIRPSRFQGFQYIHLRPRALDTPGRSSCSDNSRSFEARARLCYTRLLFSLVGYSELCDLAQTRRWVCMPTVSRVRTEFGHQIHHDRDSASVPIVSFPVLRSLPSAARFSLP